MSSTFRMIVSTPRGTLFDGEIAMLTLRGSEGELAVMAGHAPFITTVAPCDCKLIVSDDEREDRKGHTDGGLLTVTREAVTLLSGSFRWNAAE